MLIFVITGVYGLHSVVNIYNLLVDVINYLSTFCVLNKYILSMCVIKGKEKTGDMK